MEVKILENQRDIEPFKSILKNLTLLFEERLPNLIGVYLHGSLSLNCYNALTSDIDLIVVVENESNTVNYSADHLRKFAFDLIKFEEECSVALEISLVEKMEVINPNYPSNFIFHYSKLHKSRYIGISDYFCGNSTDPDLVSHFVMIRNHGIRMMGIPIGNLFIGSYDEAFKKSVLNDCFVELDEFSTHWAYYVLNYCRTAMYLESGKTGSKIDGGEWAIHKFPPEYVRTVKLALSSYKGKWVGNSPKEDIAEFREFVIRNYFT